MGNQFALSAFYRVRQVVDKVQQPSSLAVSQTDRQSTAQFNAVPKDCGVSYRTLVSAAMQRRGGDPSIASLTFNAAVKYGVPLSGTTTTATATHFTCKMCPFRPVPTDRQREGGKNYGRDSHIFPRGWVWRRLEGEP